jgi:hypothetical protein
MKLTKDELKKIIQEELGSIIQEEDKAKIDSALEDAIEELPIELLVAAASDEELKEEYNIGGYRAGYAPMRRTSGKSTFRQDQKDAEDREKARDSRLFAAEKKAKNARIAAQNHNIPIKNIESKINQVEQEVAESSRNTNIALAAGAALSFALAGPIGGIIFAVPAAILAATIKDKMQDKSEAELGDELQKLKSKRKEMGDKADVPSGRPPLSPLGPSNYFKEDITKEDIQKMVQEELEAVTKGN